MIEQVSLCYVVGSNRDLKIFVCEKRKNICVVTSGGVDTHILYN